MARTQEERKAETRARLLAAAADLFADQGIDAVSVDAVAEAAGRTSGAVYAHFGSKQGLLLALLDSWKDSVLTVLLAEVALSRLPRRPAVGRVDEPVGPARTRRRRRWPLLEHELWLRGGTGPRGRRRAPGPQRRGPPLQRPAARPAGPPPSAPVPRPTPEELAVLVKALLTGLALQKRLAPDVVPDDLALRGIAALVGLPATTAGRATGTTDDRTSTSDLTSTSD